MFQLISIYLKFVIKIGVTNIHQSICFVKFYLLILTVSEGIFHAFVLVAYFPVIGEAR